MDKTEFEELSSTLFSIIRQIDDEQSLLNIACELLGAEAGVLLRRRHAHQAEEEITIVHAHPQECLVLSRDDLRLLRSWYKDIAPPQDTDGFVKGDSVTIKDREYSDMLVSFSELYTMGNFPAYELLLFNKSETRYTSYHTWAAAQMLRQFELTSLLRKQLDIETQKKKKYAALLSIDVFNIDSWEDLHARLENLSNPIEKAKLTTEWFAYKSRKQTLSPKNLLSYLQRWKTAPLFKNVASFLLDANFPASHDNFDELCKALLSSPPQKTDIEIESLHRDQLMALALEHAWRNILELTTANADAEKCCGGETSSADGHSHKKSISNYKKQVKQLLDITKGMVIKHLAARNSQDIIDGHACISSELNELNRETLRLYFATEIAKPANRIIQLYLGGNRTDEHRAAPAELRNVFVRNLSRYMLGVVEILQKKLRIHTESWPVSPLETLDSLLYLIDRFAHVELKVDESLNIRQHLGRQISSEVHLHLNRPYYRDHLLHVIDVFLVGHLLLNTKVYWFNGETHSLAEHLEAMAKCTKSDDASLFLSAKEWLQNWAVASLLHDIGYQLGHGNSITHHPEKWVKFFELPQPAKDKWIELKKTKPEDREHWTMKPLFKFIDTFVEKLRDNGVIARHLPTIDGNTNKDHGVLSALRVIQLLIHADNGNRHSEDQCFGELPERYVSAIHAIAHHNLFSEQVAFSTHPLSCLLRICDELQEWDRRRVSIEKVVKQLYLDFQFGIDGGKFPSNSMVKSCYVNIDFSASSHKGEGLPESLTITLQNGKKPCFNFALEYHDSKDGDYDPTMTLLSKAYNLQHLDLTVPDQGQNDLTIGLTLHFPIPKEYGDLTEYDIYGLFTEEARIFPLLREFASVNDAESGLIRLRKAGMDPGHLDCFGIRITRKSDPGHRHGWLPSNPNFYYGKFIKFKEDILANNRLRNRG